MKINIAAAVAISVSGTFFSSVISAQQIYTITDSKGHPFATVKYYDPNDGPYADGGSSNWIFSPFDIDQLNQAMKHWGEIIQIIPGSSPAILNVGTLYEDNAYANSPIAFEKEGAPTKIQAALTGRDPGKLVNDAQGFVHIGTLPWTKEEYTPSQLSLTQEVSLTTVMVHEIAHAFGVITNFSASEVGNDLHRVTTGNSSNLFSTHLYDDNGQKLRSNQVVWCAFCENTKVNSEGENLDSKDIFDARKNHVYFSGKYVNEVLAGAMAGIPMTISSSIDPNELDIPPFSHFELKNSMMSHQPYRNYTTFIEAEIAVLQDLGYKIDRRNFFGYSVYGNEQTFVNDNPFFGRNAEGTAYVKNTYNTATLGLGLHVYGSNNKISQRADLLSMGVGGAGIRIDGVSNDLTVLPEAHVYANGINGRGVMFAYGKDHTVTHRGDIEALGKNGIAVSFDFGHNLFGDGGDLGEVRGSYIHYGENSLRRYVEEVIKAVRSEINGPLVRIFDLTGRVAGSKAAIYMSDNAYVRQINVMQGASIAGDIISNYAEVDENKNLRLTTLTFGKTADLDGRSTGVANRDFALAYAGNMLGDNLSLQIDGGITVLTGAHWLYNAAVAQGATLAGAGSYQIAASQQLHNSGVLNPSIVGKAITIDGDYTQSGKGTLKFAFNDQKAISSLVVHGNAELDGAVSFSPERGYYANNFSISSDQWLQGNVIYGAFSNVTTTRVSPTLNVMATDNDDNRYTVSLSRSANAYSQYGDTKNGRSVGYALDQAGSYAAPGLQPMLTALDFSDPDGSTIRSSLAQLSPEAYASANGVLINASSATRLSINNRLSQAFGDVSVSPVSVVDLTPEHTPITENSTIKKFTLTPSNTVDLNKFVSWGTVLGSRSSQSGNENSASTQSTLGGFTTGVDASVNDNWRLGVMAGYSHSTFKTNKLDSSGSSKNYTLGTYTGTEWATSQGAVGFRSGLSYSWHGLEMRRSVAFNGFSDSLSADYNARIFQIFGELGYKHSLIQNTILEPYANLAYLHLTTDNFTEKGGNGAALTVRSSTMNTTLSTLGMRASTNFDLGTTLMTARTDFGWRHAMGDLSSTTSARFAAGLNLFSATGNSIGKDTALIEAGLDFAITKDVKTGIAYDRQFGSGLTQNGMNVNFTMKF